MGNSPSSIARDIGSVFELQSAFRGVLRNEFDTALTGISEYEIFSSSEFKWDDLFTRNELKDFENIQLKKPFTLNELASKRVVVLLTTALQKDQFKNLVKIMNAGYMMYITSELQRNLAAHIVGDTQASLCYNANKTFNEKPVPLTANCKSGFRLKILGDKLDPTSTDKGVLLAIANRVAKNSIPKIYDFSLEHVENVLKSLETGINQSKSQVDRKRVAALANCDK